MRIGILTYHRSDNFGALFQAIASRRYLESLGHEAYHIDYWPEYHKAMYAPFSWWLFWRKGLKGKFFYLKRSIKKYSESKDRRGKYTKFVKKYIEPHCAPQGMIFDVIIYGSDQIWRKQPYIDTYNPVYFAHNDYKAKHHIALSASMGILPSTQDDKEYFKSLLDRFDSISVREQSLKELVEEFGYTATLTCDPALFLTSEQWNEVFPQSVVKRRGYLLLVNYIEGSFDTAAVKSLAKMMGLDYVRINGSVIQHSEVGDLRNVAPLELFDYIRNADFVCTSSFHALVFSLLYHKQCYAAFKHNAKRAESLLIALGIESRLLEPRSMMMKPNDTIDYSTVDAKMGELRNNTFDFIGKALID